MGSVLCRYRTSVQAPRRVVGCLVLGMLLVLECTCLEDGPCLLRCLCGVREEGREARVTGGRGELKVEAVTRGGLLEGALVEHVRRYFVHRLVFGLRLDEVRPLKHAKQALQLRLVAALSEQRVLQLLGWLLQQGSRIRFIL